MALTMTATWTGSLRGPDGRLGRARITSPAVVVPATYEGSRYDLARNAIWYAAPGWLLDRNPAWLSAGDEYGTVEATFTPGEAPDARWVADELDRVVMEDGGSCSTYGQPDGCEWLDGDAVAA